MVSRPSRRKVNPQQPAAPDSIDPESLPPPIRRAYERYRRPDGPRHRPKGDGAHIYARVSSEEQAGTGKTSLNEQIRHGEKALDGTGIPIVGIWRDEGFSGFSRFSERLVGRELFKAVKAARSSSATASTGSRGMLSWDWQTSTTCGDVALGC
jgi:hypothetical protein